MTLRRTGAASRAHPVGLAALACCLFGGCADADEAPRLAVQQLPILGGDEADAMHAGVAVVTAGERTCTGTLLTRRWMVTAAECFCDEHVAAPESVTLSSGLITTHATRIVLDDTLNVAFVRSRLLLPLQGEVLLWEGSSQDLIGRGLECYGYGGGAVEEDGGIVTGRRPTSGTLSVTRAGGTLGSSAPACGASRSVDGFVTQDGELGTDDDDAGGPCFLDEGGSRFLVGVRGGAIAAQGDTPAETLWVGVDAIRPRLRAATDVFSAEECARDVPGSERSLDPVLAPVTPDETYLTLIAVDPYGFDAGGEVKLWQTTDQRLATWASVDASAIGPVRTAHATPAFVPGRRTELPLLFAIGDHDDHMVIVSWLETSGFGALDYVPDELAAAGPASGIGFLALVASSGIATAALRDSSFSTGWAMDRFPFAEPELDVHYQPTASSVAFDGDIVGLMGFRGLDDRMYLHSVSWTCLFLYNTTTWCAEATPYDFAAGREYFSLDMDPQRDVYAVTSDYDGIMSLWYLDADAGAPYLGSISGRSMSRPTIGEHQGETMVAYTTDDWTVRVKPAGNCLGNTPADL